MKTADISAKTERNRHHQKIELYLSNFRGALHKQSHDTDIAIKVAVEALRKMIKMDKTKK